MVNFNGISWDILLVSSNHPALQKLDGSWTLGSCDNESRTIYIQDNLREEKMKKVLCHELTHAAMFSYNIFLTLQQEELLADLIATYGQEIIDTTNRIFFKIKKRGV